MGKSVDVIYITLILWYYCVITINAQSFGVLFGQTSVPILSGTKKMGFPTISVKNQTILLTNNNIDTQYSILQTLYKFYEWILSYFTFVRSNHVEEKNHIESSSPTYSNSANLQLQHTYLSTSQKSTTCMPVFLHAPLGRNASQSSWSHSYGKQFDNNQHPWYSQSLYGRPFLSIAQLPYRSYGYHALLSYGRSSNRLPQR